MEKRKKETATINYRFGKRALRKEKYRTKIDRVVKSPPRRKTICRALAGRAKSNTFWEVTINCQNKRKINLSWRIKN